MKSREICLNGLVPEACSAVTVILLFFTKQFSFMDSFIYHVQNSFELDVSPLFVQALAEDT